MPPRSRSRGQALFLRPQVSVPAMHVGELVGHERLPGQKEGREFIITGLKGP